VIAKSACATSCRAPVFFLRELNLLKVSTGPLIFGIRDLWVPPQEAHEKKMCPRPPTQIEESAKRPPTAAWSELRNNENADVSINIFRCSTRLVGLFGLFGPVARCESSPALLPHPISTGGVCLEVAAVGGGQRSWCCMDSL
jgi:hypothetical protein